MEVVFAKETSSLAIDKGWNRRGSHVWVRIELIADACDYILNLCDYFSDYAMCFTVGRLRRSMINRM